MKNSNIIFFIIIFSIPIKSFSQETQVYKHPTLQFQITASQNLINIHHPEDELLYEMMSPDSNMHVMLWYTETEQNARGYLTKMASMKDLNVGDEKPFLKTINDQEIWILNVAGCDGKLPIQTLLAATSHGMSIKHPKENRLFIIQIWCQKENYPRHKSKFEKILNSVQIKDK
jgi:hypothetical protein